MSARVVIRELKTPEEFLATMDVSKAAWGFAERSVSPASDLIAATHAGGLTAAAFAGKRMLGFVHGFPRTNLAEPCQYSHLLAVLPEAQGRGLAVKLKHFQRDWCLARGIRLVTWMYDPFLVKNATLNLVRLGATADRFHPNLYGFIGGIYADLPSDRFEAYWRLEAPRAVRAAAGEIRTPCDAAGAPVARNPRALPGAPRVLLPFPAGAPRLYRTDPGAALKARRRFAALVEPLFARGYTVTDIVSTADGSPAYVLDRRTGA
ncbi:MAG: GNAT family N-acetyltransferase [Acidobacteriota bacterium]